MTRFSVRLLLGALAASILAAGVVATPGCGRDPRQTTVITSEEAPQTGITPIERGRIRSQVLKTMRQAIGTWRAGDIVAMKRYFSRGLVDYDAKLKAEYAKKGQVRVRRHSGVFLDVVEMKSDGTQAVVQYTFTNRSYFADRRTRRPVTKPSNKHGEIDITLDRRSSGWMVVRMFSSKDELM